MSNLINCKKCGKLFLSSKWTFCESCLAETMATFNQIEKFIRASDHPVILDEIIDNLSVSVKDFEHLLSSGRLLELADKVSLQCPSCGKVENIKNRFSFLCLECASVLKHNVGQPKKYIKNREE